MIAGWPASGSEPSASPRVPGLAKSPLWAQKAQENMTLTLACPTSLHPAQEQRAEPEPRADHCCLRDWRWGADRDTLRLAKVRAGVGIIGVFPLGWDRHEEENLGGASLEWESAGSCGLLGWAPSFPRSGEAGPPGWALASIRMNPYSQGRTQRQEVVVGWGLWGMGLLIKEGAGVPSTPPWAPDPPLGDSFWGPP